MARPEASREEHEGDNSEGFKTATFPAATAPISGSRESPVFVFQLRGSVFVHHQLNEETLISYRI